MRRGSTLLTTKEQNNRCPVKETIEIRRPAAVLKAAAERAARAARPVAAKAAAHTAA
jgi:hypothetical protein